MAGRPEPDVAESEPPVVTGLDEAAYAARIAEVLRKKVWQHATPETVVHAERVLLPEVRNLIFQVARAMMPTAKAVFGEDCPHCDPVHRDPTSRPWGVYVAPAVDADGQPEYLIVRPSNGAHVAESDATWLWELIRNA